jgi:hypothetical protein
MTREEVADELSEIVRRRRLERAGMRDAIGEPHVGFDGLPTQEQENWLDVADAAIELFGDRP